MKLFPVVFESGFGCVLKDVDGNEYIDFSSGIYVTGLGHCHPKITEAVQKAAATLTTGSITPSKLRRLNRAFFGAAFILNVDGQGRLVLPIPLRQYAGIEDDEVIIIGANAYFEIWNKEQWEEEKAISQEQAWQIIESLERH